jgi:hypothetical protein
MTQARAGQRQLARAAQMAQSNVHRYRPRIEGLFARIERWSSSIEAKSRNFGTNNRKCKFEVFFFQFRDYRASAPFYDLCPPFSRVISKV